jgi:hypothetical protein
MSAKLTGTVKNVNGNPDVQIGAPVIRPRTKVVTPTGKNTPYVQSETYLVRTFAPKPSSSSPSSVKGGVSRLTPVLEIIR